MKLAAGGCRSKRPWPLSMWPKTPTFTFTFTRCPAVALSALPALPGRSPGPTRKAARSSAARAHPFWPGLSPARPPAAPSRWLRAQTLPALSLDIKLALSLKASPEDLEGHLNYSSPAGMGNFSVITEFLLMEFSSRRELQVLHTLLFLLIYLAALMGNLLTIAAIITEPHLHCPMYFFLSNLSLLDICTISVTLPKFIVNSLSGTQSLSLLDCAAQIFFFLVFSATEFALLVAMSYDRFVAICHPLHYGIVMTPARCVWAAAGSWLSGLIYSAVHTGNLFRLPFSGSKVIHQFFCDIPHVLKVSASDVFHTEFELVCAQDSSMEGRHKAISTCSPQLVILMLFLISVMIAVLKDTSDTSPIENLLIAMAYTILPPLMNPIIYSLRNQKVTAAMGKMIKKIFSSHP
uniref:Olfactory receptor 14I1-like n=1 Tax=Phascolarctos cinereus TaxID=38626 RepID=A0A6P5JEJ7_PHACI|nr:olfactory receptor 14I1-like [Phascolarctos cinereus]